MVHALKQVHGILRRGGLLINVNDLAVPHLIEVHSMATVLKAGWLMDKEDFAYERSAFNALAQVVLDRQFILEDERDFDFDVHVDSIDELTELLAEKWKSALIPDRTFQNIEALFQNFAGTAKIVLRVPARMTKLRAE